MAAEEAATGAETLATRAAGAAFTFVEAMLRSLPSWLIAGLLPGAVRLIETLAVKDVSRLERNVARIYGLPRHSSFATTFRRQVIAHQLATALETMRIIRQPSRVQLIGMDELRDLVAKSGAELGKTPLIFVTAHLGSWELCAATAATAFGGRLHVLAKPPKVRGARLWLERLRSKMQVRVLWTDSRTLLREMIGALRRGEALGFVMDQKPEGRRGPIVPFFGIPTAFVSGPAAMAIKADCPVVSIFCLREGPWRYRIVSDALRVAGDQRDELALTAAMAAAIESAIRTYPEQWTWNYKRWPT